MLHGWSEHQWNEIIKACDAKTHLRKCWGEDLYVAGEHSVHAGGKRFKLRHEFGHAGGWRHTRVCAAKKRVAKKITRMREHVTRRWRADPQSFCSSAKRACAVERDEQADE